MPLNIMDKVKYLWCAAVLRCIPVGRHLFRLFCLNGWMISLVSPYLTLRLWSDHHLTKYKSSRWILSLIFDLVVACRGYVSKKREPQAPDKDRILEEWPIPKTRPERALKPRRFASQYRLLWIPKYYKYPLIAARCRRQLLLNCIYGIITF